MAQTNLKVTSNFKFGTKSEVRRGMSKGLVNALRFLDRINRQTHNYTDRTGLLTASHRYRAKGLKGALQNTAPYAHFVHDGTKRHFIKPVKAKALAWVGPDGKTRFSKGHWVKGITARKWMLNNTLDNMDKVTGIILAEGMGAIIKEKP